MKRITPLLLLIGCTSLEGMRDRVPDIDVLSVKSPEEVATCIADSWERVSFFGGSTNVNFRPTMNSGYMVSIYNSRVGRYETIADISENEKGSRTQYRFQHGVLGLGSFGEAVKQCQ